MENLDALIEQTNALGHKLEILSHIKSGKEASVFRALFDERLVAMKVYKNPDERSFQADDSYLAGKFYKSASARKAVAKKNTFGRKLKHENWIKREFFMLQKLYKAGATIPEPILQIDRAIFMELLGDEKNVAPRLVDVELSPKDAVTAFKDVVESMKIFWNLGIVHADLSAYNILWWKSKPYIIDFPQSIDARTHPEARGMLHRDLKNVSKYFDKYRPIDPQRLEAEFK
ncbi:MAG: RIO1 family regulatory kinase/ATPase [Patescibacteria group bacterium]|mgnify:CR=1 FL=1